MVDAQQILAVVFFLVTALGLGYTLLWLARATRPSHTGIRCIETLVVGTATFSFLGILLHTLHIPLRPPFYVALALAVPLVALWHSRKEIATKFRIPTFSQPSLTTLCTLALVILLVAYGSLMWSGANAYPYLEDDDPWNYAQAAAYVATTGDYEVDPQARALNPGYAFYIEAYPPAYGAMMGVFFQMGTPMMWTLRFWNTILICIALLACFLLAREILRNDAKALAVAVGLAALPSFMSHFIWSQSIALLVLPIALVAAIKAIDDKTWVAPAIILVASQLITQVFSSLVFAFTLITIAIFVFIHDATKPNKGKPRWNIKFASTLRTLIVGAGGVVLSLIHWAPELFINRTQNAAGEAVSGALIENFLGAYLSGYTQRVYAWHDIFFPPNSSMIDQAIGWGVGLIAGVLLFVILCLWKGKVLLNPRRDWRYLFLSVWTIGLCWIVLGPTLGLPAFGTSRSWAYAAIPLVIVAVEGYSLIVNSILRTPLLRALGIVGVFVLIAFTVLPAKIAVQTAQWPPGVHWAAPQAEVPGYVQMQGALAPHTRVYPFCGVNEGRVIGFDMAADPWDLEEGMFRTQGLNHTPEQTLDFLLRKNYQYFTIDASCVRDYGANETNDFINGLVQTGRVQPTITTQGFLLARIA